MNDLSMLDMNTMAFASSISGFVMAATMLGIYHAGMRSRAILDWFIAGLAFGLGNLIGNLTQIMIDLGPLAVSLANALVSTGQVFVLIGVLRYLDNRTWTAPLLIVITLLLVGGIVIEPLRDSQHLRVLVYSSFHLVLSIWAGVVMWRADKPGMRFFHRLVALVLLCYGAAVAFGLFNLVLLENALGMLDQAKLQTLAFLAAMVFGFLLTMALAVMMFREKQVELMRLAEKDPLTGMNNRLSLDAVADQYMALAERRDLELSILLFDLDHFKRVNDEFGHQVGDRVLTEIARRIERVMRGDDVAFRFGGEEFLALLPGADIVQAEQIAERLRRTIAETPIEIQRHQLKLTASFGVVQYIPGNESWDDCVRRVDEALYQAKRDGRNRISRHLVLALAAP